MKLEFLQKQVRDAAQDVHKEYRDYPLVFLNEKDVRCALYARLKSQLKKPYRVPTYESGSNTKRAKVPVFTCAVHAELHMWDEGREFVDLCIIDKDAARFWVVPNHWNPYKTGQFRVKNYDWSKRDTIGIEIKQNRWYTDVTGKDFAEYTRVIARDFKKLKGYRRGWFIFVDNCSLFKRPDEWKAYIRKLLHRASKSSREKGKLNAIYLRPNVGRAWIYKPYWK